jgi:hypothetical protein
MEITKQKIITELIQLGIFVGIGFLVYGLISLISHFFEQDVMGYAFMFLLAMFVSRTKWFSKDIPKFVMERTINGECE